MHDHRYSYVSISFHITLKLTLTLTLTVTLGVTLTLVLATPRSALLNTDYHFNVSFMLARIFSPTTLKRSPRSLIPPPRSPQCL